jgi:hypothetical protein
MQRFERAGCGPDTEATAIYIVEPAYFDHAKKKIIGKQKQKGAKRGRSQKRQQKNKPVEVSVEINEDNLGDSDNSSEQEGMDIDKESNEVLLSPPSSSAAELGFPLSTDPEYKVLAMDCFINARAQGYCRRQVSNKYYDNNKAGEF